MLEKLGSQFSKFMAEEPTDQSKQIAGGVTQPSRTLDGILKKGDTKSTEDFGRLCHEIKKHFEDFELATQNDSLQENTDRLKKALLGKSEAVNYYYAKIEDYIKTHKKTRVHFPDWYDNLTEAIFHEVWGFAGIWKWIKKGTSSSCKVIQPNIYAMNEDGVATLLPQKITAERFSTLKRRLLLNNTKMKEHTSYQELTMEDGTRIQIFNNHKTENTEGIIIFRRYTLGDYRFEKLAELETIGHEAVPLLEKAVECGFNIVALGPVRSGKTGFFTTYQSYEDPTLEGVYVETTSEVSMKDLLPDAPIMELISDGEELEDMVKPLMRSDADYLMIGEAREGRALRLMLRMTSKGTRRVKGTFHTGKPHNFCYDVAEEIVNVYGGSLWPYMIRVAENFNLLFQMVSDPYNKAKKRLVGIYELQFDEETMEIRTNAWCKFDFKEQSWSYNAKFIAESTREDAYIVSIDAYHELVTILENLAKQYPMTGDPISVSPYSKLIGKG